MITLIFLLLAKSIIDRAICESKTRCKKVILEDIRSDLINFCKSMQQHVLKLNSNNFNKIINSLFVENELSSLIKKICKKEEPMYFCMQFTTQIKKNEQTKWIYRTSTSSC